MRADSGGYESRPTRGVLNNAFGTTLSIALSQADIRHQAGAIVWRRRDFIPKTTRNGSTRLMISS